jgi:hypothetical protein
MRGGTRGGEGLRIGIGARGGGARGGRRRSGGARGGGGGGRGGGGRGGGGRGGGGRGGGGRGGGGWERCERGEAGGDAEVESDAGEGAEEREDARAELVTADERGAAVPAERLSGWRVGAEGAKVGLGGRPEQGRGGRLGRARTATGRAGTKVEVRVFGVGGEGRGGEGVTSSRGGPCRPAVTRAVSAGSAG